jgi:hypothetical protein
VFTTSGEKPTATSVVLQGTSVLAGGSPYGQGVRCVGGTLKRLYTKAAVAGSITAPNFGAGDPTVSARSAAKGDPISAGEIRSTSCSTASRPCSEDARSCARSTRRRRERSPGRCDHRAGGSPAFIAPDITMSAYAVPYGLW